MKSMFSCSLCRVIFLSYSHVGYGAFLTGHLGYQKIFGRGICGIWKL